MQTQLYKGSIKKRLRTIIVSVVFMSAILGYSGFAYWYMSSQQERAIELSRSVSLVLSQDFAKLLLLGELSAASDITTKLKSFEKLNTLVLYNLEKRPLYQYHKEDRSFIPKKLDDKTPSLPKCASESLEIFIPAEYEGVELGKIGLSFEIDSIATLLKRDAFFLLLLALFIFTISYILAEIFAKRFTAPILKLVAFLEDIELATLSKKRVETKQKDEFAKLYDEINTMLLRLYKAQEEQKIAAVAFDTPSGMTITDADQKILRINRAFTTITGYTEDDVLGKTPSILSSGYHDKSFYDDMFSSLKKSKYWSGEVLNRHKNGDIFPEMLTIQAITDTEGNPEYYVAAFLDLTLQKNIEKKLEFLRKYDPLTSLANKEQLINELQNSIDNDNSKTYGVLFCIDLTNFKLINEAHGHQAGDSVLKSIAQRLKESLDSATLHARIGADEFALWYKDFAKSSEEAEKEAKEISQEIVYLLSQPYKIKTQSIHSIPCVGIALYSSQHKSATEIIQQADAALHLAKTEEQSNISFFDNNTQILAKNHLTLYTQLLHALKEEHFELFYQGQYNQDAKLCGAEALVRWIDPQRGIVSPLEFIPIAEKTSLIIPLGLWILKTAAKQLALLQANKSTQNLSIAINISAKQFYQEDFVSIIKELIEENALDPRGLKLELTESLLVKDLETVIDKMRELRNLGILLSLDDFGTGYSSLEYLKKLPLDQIKIDQSFVKNMLTNRSDIAIIKTIISLANAFELEVIAEGVETQRHYEALMELGCRAFQGYHFTKPQKAQELFE